MMVSWLRNDMQTTLFTPKGQEDTMQLSPQYTWLIELNKKLKVSVRFSSANPLIKPFPSVITPQRFPLV